jgi:hypothetical protein
MKHFEQVKGPNMTREGVNSLLKFYKITRAIWLVWQTAWYNFALALQGLQATYPTNSSCYNLQVNQWLSHYELSKASYTKEFN